MTSPSNLYKNSLKQLIPHKQNTLLLTVYVPKSLNKL